MSDTEQLPPEQDTLQSKSGSREWHFRDFFSVLYRRRWVAIATFLTVAALVATYTLTAIHIYEAEAQILLTERPNIMTFQGTGAQPDDQLKQMETQHRLLRSRSLARRVIEELDLWDAPELSEHRYARQGGMLGTIGAWRNQIDRMLSGRSLTGSEPKDPKETLAETGVINRFLSDLIVVPIRDTRIIQVKFESSNPEFAVKIVNNLTALYIKQNLEARAQATKAATEWLSGQLAEQRRKVEVSELALQQYRERENSLSLEAGQNIVVQRLTALNSSVTQAKTELIAAEAMYRQLMASPQTPAALDTLPAIRSNGIVQGIRARLADLQRERTQLAGSLGVKHPDMIRLDAAINAARAELATEVAKTVESVRQEYLAALSRERELAAALNAQKASALALNRQGIEYGVLLREVESNRQIYQSLLQRANETAVSSDLNGTNIEVVDAAEVPRIPVRPDKTANFLVGLLLSAILSIGMAFVWEAFDSRVQSPADVKDLGLPFLGMLPYVSPKTLRGRSLLLSSGVPAAYAEAFRSVRTSVLASAGAKGSRSLLVTSAAPADGKSVVAVNLALALGRSGGRVLLIDADMRRPNVHHLLGCNQRPGLSEILSGARKPSEAIIATRSQGLWVLPSGAGLPNPSEHLGSKRFSELLERLDESFDWVVIDSPPVMAVTDPAVIAHLVSGVLFVVNARCTRQQVAQAALDQLETAGAKFAGAVLNSVTLERDHYYNSRYYLPFYGDYVSDKRTA